MNVLQKKLNQIEDINNVLKTLENELRDIHIDYINEISKICSCPRDFGFNIKKRLITIFDKNEQGDIAFIWFFKSNALDINIQVPIDRKVVAGDYGYNAELILKIQNAINRLDDKYNNSNSEEECDAVSEVRKFEKITEGSSDVKIVKKSQNPFDVNVVPFSDRVEKKKSDYSKSIKKDVSKQPDVMPVTDSTFKSLEVIEGELHHFDSPETRSKYLKERNRADK